MQGVDAVLESPGASWTRSALALSPPACLTHLWEEGRYPHQCLCSRLLSPALFPLCLCYKSCCFCNGLQPPLPQTPAICKRRKTLLLFTFVILCPGDVLREEVLGGGDWASGGWSHRDAHGTMRALSSPTSPTLHLTDP